MKILNNYDTLRGSNREEFSSAFQKLAMEAHQGYLGKDSSRGSWSGSGYQTVGGQEEKMMPARNDERATRLTAAVALASRAEKGIARPRPQGTAHKTRR